MSENRLVALKIAYNDEIHRIRVNLGDFRFQQLEELFKKTFHLGTQEVIHIQYKDLEGDCIAVGNEEEYKEAVESYLSKNENHACLRFYMTTMQGSSLQFQEQLAKPLVQALEKLIEQLQSTVHLLKNQDWKNKYDKSVETADQLLQNAKETVKTATQNIQENMKDTPFEQIIKDTGDGLKAAVDGLNGFAKELIEEVKNIQKMPEAGNAQNVEVTANNEVQQESSKVSVKEGNMMFENDDWQNVAQDSASNVEVQPSAAEAPTAQESATLNSANTIEEPSEVPLDPTVAVGVHLICEVFPACGKQTALRLLAEADNNVEVVLNRLAEEGY